MALFIWYFKNDRKFTILLCTYYKNRVSSQVFTSFILHINKRLFVYILFDFIFFHFNGLTSSKSKPIVTCLHTLFLLWVLIGLGYCLCRLSLARLLIHTLLFVLLSTLTKPLQQLGNWWLFLLFCRCQFFNNQLWQRRGNSDNQLPLTPPPGEWPANHGLHWRVEW